MRTVRQRAATSLAMTTAPVELAPLKTVSAEQIASSARNMRLPDTKAERWAWLETAVGMTEGSAILVGRLITLLCNEDGVTTSEICSRLRVSRNVLYTYMRIGEGVLPEAVIKRPCPLVDRAVMQRIPAVEIDLLCKSSKINVVNLVKKGRSWEAKVTSKPIEDVTATEAKWLVRDRRLASTKADLEHTANELIRIKREEAAVKAADPYIIENGTITFTIARSFTWPEWQAINKKFHDHITWSILNVEDELKKRQIARK